MVDYQGKNMIKLLSSATAMAAFLIVAPVSQSSAKGFCGLVGGDKYNGSGTHVKACPKMGEYRRFHVTTPERFRPAATGIAPAKRGSRTWTRHGSTPKGTGASSHPGAAFR